MNERWFRSYSYYWVVDQAEYATDLIFTSREALGWSLSAAVGPRRGQLLGQRHPEFLGATSSIPGSTGRCSPIARRSLARARIKHRMKNNWLKMYDKFGWVLRIETVINNPREFRVRRLRTRGERREISVCCTDEQERDQPLPTTARWRWRPTAATWTRCRW